MGNKETITILSFLDHLRHVLARTGSSIGMGWTARFRKVGRALLEWIHAPLCPVIPVQKVGLGSKTAGVRQQTAGQGC
jgi:hypothetical protein